MWGQPPAAPAASGFSPGDGVRVKGTALDGRTGKIVSRAAHMAGRWVVELVGVGRKQLDEAKLERVVAPPRARPAATARGLLDPRGRWRVSRPRTTDGTARDTGDRTNAAPISL